MSAVKLTEASKTLLKDLIKAYNLYDGKEVSIIKDNGAVLLGPKPGYFTQKAQEEVDFIDVIKEITSKISAAKNGRAEHFYVTYMISKIFDSFIKLDKNEIIRKIYIAHLTNECPMLVVSYEGKSYEVPVNSPVIAKFDSPNKQNNNQGGDKGGNQNNNQNGQNQNQKQNKDNNNGGGEKNNQKENNGQNQNNQQGKDNKKEPDVIVLKGNSEEIAGAMAHLVNSGQACVVTEKKN